MCKNLTSVTILNSNVTFGSGAIPGNLREKYLEGGPGTYTRESEGSTWTKQGTSESSRTIENSTTTEISNNSPQTKGKLTITGLGDYNGNYVIATPSDSTGIDLYAGKSFNESYVITGETITNGSVSLNVWKEQNTELYGGNDNYKFRVWITTNEFFALESEVYGLKATGELTITFNNGVASGKIMNLAEAADPDW